MLDFFRNQDIDLNCISSVEQMTGKDPLTPPWKLDPCKMEAHGINKEMVRLTEGLLRISWTPNRHSPKYKLIITTLGKGYHCNQGKHPCLKFGFVSINQIAFKNNNKKNKAFYLISLMKF